MYLLPRPAHTGGTLANIMKNLAIALIFLFSSHFLYAQCDSINIAEVNSLLNFCHENIDADSIALALEKQFNLNLCTLSGNLMLYSFQNSLNLTTKEIKTIENLSNQIIVDAFKQGLPIKIFKEGGIGGGGKIRVEKSEINGIILNSVFLSKTDVRFEEDSLENKLIEIINQKTSELIKTTNQ